MIFTISVCGQILIVEHGGTAFQTVPLDKDLWITSIIIGLVSIPVGATIRLIPDDFVSLSFHSSKNINKSSHYITDNNENTTSFKGEQTTNQSLQKYNSNHEKISHNEIDKNGIDWSINIV